MATELEPFKRARLDQWDAFLGEVVGHTSEHLKVCKKPAGACVGPVAAELIEGMKAIEAKMLVEMAIMRLAGQRRAGFLYEPSFHCFIPNRPGEDPDDHEHDSAIQCDWGWICNGDGCTFRTDDVPCPEHAPVAVPELRLVECNTEPRHWLWVHHNDDYGHGCPLCWVDQKNAELAPLKHAQWLREHRWCWATNRAKRALCKLRLMRHTSSESGCRGDFWHISARWRWSR